MENLVKENKAFDAAEFYVKDWVDENGNTTNQIKLSDFKGKFKVVYCFQTCQVAMVFVASHFLYTICL